MIRINLLPPEITQKRREETQWRWVAVFGVVLFAFLLGFYLVMFWQVSMKQSEVAEAEQQVATLQTRVAEVAIFETKEKELEQRKALVDHALAGRVDWARLLYEISLVLPTDVNLITLTGVEDDPLTEKSDSTTEEDSSNEGELTIVGGALDPHDLPDTGYTTIAKMLVRLADLEQLDRVWLETAVKSAQSATLPDPDAKTFDFPSIDFTVRAALMRAVLPEPAQSQTPPAVAAPPATTAP